MEQQQGQDSNVSNLPSLDMDDEPVMEDDLEADQSTAPSSNGHSRNTVTSNDRSTTDSSVDPSLAPPNISTVFPEDRLFSCAPDAFMPDHMMPKLLESPAGICISDLLHADLYGQPRLPSRGSSPADVLAQGSIIFR